MGYVRACVLIGDAGKRKVKEVVFLVDTEAFFPVIPLYLAKELGKRFSGSYPRTFQKQL